MMPAHKRKIAMSMTGVLNARGSTASNPIMISDTPDQVPAALLSKMPTEIKVKILRHVLDSQREPQRKENVSIIHSINPDLLNRPGHIILCFHYGHRFRSEPSITGISGIFGVSRIWQNLGYELLYQKNLFTFLGSTMTGRPGSVSKIRRQTVLQQWSFSKFISPLISELRIGLSDGYCPSRDLCLRSTLMRFPQLRKLTFDMWNGWDSWGPSPAELMACCRTTLEFVWCIEVDVPDEEGREDEILQLKDSLEQRNKKRQARI